MDIENLVLIETFDKLGIINFWQKLSNFINQSGYKADKLELNIRYESADILVVIRPNNDTPQYLMTAIMQDKLIEWSEIADSAISEQDYCNKIETEISHVLNSLKNYQSKNLSVEYKTN